MYLRYIRVICPSTVVTLTSVKICGEIKTAFEQSVCVIYLLLFVLVTFSKLRNIFNTMEEFFKVCILGIPLRMLILKFSLLVFPVFPCCTNCKMYLKLF